MKAIHALCLMLAALMLFSCGNNGGEPAASSEPGETAGQTPPSSGAGLLTIADNGTAEYRIVIPAAEDVYFDVAYQLASAIERAAGAAPEIVKDTFSASDAEIWLGPVNRSVAQQSCASIGNLKDYRIFAVENDLLFAGCSPEAVQSAVTEWVRTYVNGIKDGVITMEKDAILESHYSYQPGELEAEQLNNRTDADAETLAPEVTEVYVPVAEDDNYFNLYTNLVCFQDRIYLVWASSPADEDDVGQQILMSSSPLTEDGMQQWTEPVQVVDPVMGEHCELTFFAPVLDTAGELLVLTYASIEWKESLLSVAQDGSLHRPQSNQNYGEKTLWRQTSTDGVNWSAPEKLFENDQICANDAPIRINDTLLWACNRTILTSDDLSGAGDFDIVTRIDANSAIARGAKTLMESGMYAAGDRLYMTFRSNTGYLWASVSTDGGSSWSQAYQTQFTDAKTLCKFLNLPDGRVLYVGSPDPLDQHRDQLVIAISDDGISFDRQYILRLKNADTFADPKPGFAKGGTFNYPDVCVAGDYVYVAYTVQKERVEVARIPLAELA